MSTDDHRRALLAGHPGAEALVDEAARLLALVEESAHRWGPDTALDLVRRLQATQQLLRSFVGDGQGDEVPGEREAVRAQWAGWCTECGAAIPLDHLRASP